MKLTHNGCQGLDASPSRIASGILLEPEHAVSISRLERERKWQKEKPYGRLQTLLATAYGLTLPRVSLILAVPHQLPTVSLCRKQFEAKLLEYWMDPPVWRRGCSDPASRSAPHLSRRPARQRTLGLCASRSCTSRVQAHCWVCL